MKIGHKYTTPVSSKKNLEPKDNSYITRLQEHYADKWVFKDVDRGIQQW